MQFNKLSFWSLLSDIDINTITIPIIQRAYTQGGREEDSKIEEKGGKFLNRLLEALENKSKPILLDFIYGSKIKKQFFPLDGQQRLTTLFLLYWYIAQKENRLDNNVISTLKKFTYKTRQSSRYFCEHLCQYTVSSNRKEKLSDTIKNEKWYISYSWNADPSIRSMLKMLDKIDIALQNNDSLYWDILTSDIENCPITFFYTSLEELNLTDDLYIKMNSRGLELTDFEKIKAGFNQKIDNENWDKDKSITEKFSLKIDTIWTDLFWKHKGSNKIVDSMLVNFIAGIAINNYALQYSSNQKNEIEKQIAELTNDSTKVNQDYFNDHGYEYLVKCLDIYTINDLVKSNTDLWDYIDNTLFEDFIVDKPNFKRRIDYYTYAMRVLFFAQTEYLLNNNFEQTKFDDWMRVVRNIVENSTVDSASTFISAITLIKELSVGSSDIYSYLVRETIKAGFGKKQIEQEIIKARIILSNPNVNKQIIFDTEDINFCKGDIDFVLYCINYDKSNISSFDAERLTKLKDIIKDELDINEKITDDFKRAFLTIKDNDYYNKNWFSWSSSFECHKRYLLDKNSDLVSYFAKSKDFTIKNYLKDLLTQRMINRSFADIADAYSIPNGIPRWKAKLIKGEKEIKGATFILFPDDNSCCFLAKRQRPSREDQVVEISND